MEKLTTYLARGVLVALGLVGCSAEPASSIDRAAAESGSGDVGVTTAALSRWCKHAPGHPYCRHRCGDGRVDRHEACDDGNREDGDGCSAECQLDDITATPGDERPGYVWCRQAKLTCGPDQGCCAQPNPTGPACAAERDECGPNPTFQACDGPEDCPADVHCVGTRFGDVCEAKGYYWVCHTDADCEPSRPKCDEAGICRAVDMCGDGIVGDTEACDDGNSDSGDGCSADCEHDDNTNTPGDDRAGYVACGAQAPELTCGPEQGCCTRVTDAEGNPIGPFCAEDRTQCPVVPSFHACDGPEDCEDGASCMGTRFGNTCGNGYYRICHVDADCESSRPTCDDSGACIP